MQRWPRRTLPTNLNPVGTRCIQITIPDDDDWERDIYAEVVTLAQWMRWERDLGKNGKPVADIWLNALKTWKHCDGSPSPIHGMEVDEEMPLRVDCDCNVFITCCDGTEKQILTSDQVKALQAPQQGNGAPQASPGGCQLWQAVIDAGKFWLMPQPVNTGDIITPSEAHGASTDVAPLGRWNCPDGSYYAAGQCYGGSIAHDPSALVPASPLGVPVININGTWHDFTAPITVGGGVSNQNCAVALNYASGGDFSGTVILNVQLCNNSTGDVNISYSHGSGIASAPYGSVFTVTAANIGSDVRIDMAFDKPVKLSVIAQSGYVNVGTPGPSNQWCGAHLGGTQIVILTDPPDTIPTDFPAGSTVDDLAMDTGGPGSVFTITLKMEAP